MNDKERRKEERASMVLFHYLTKMSKLMGLNVLVLLFSLPVFTAGAAICAMHKVVQLILEDEEYWIFLDFWKAFKENFKNATVIWLIYLPIFGLLIYNVLMLHSGRWLEAPWLQIPLLIIGACLLSALNWALILQTRFDNKAMGTLRNGVLFCVAYPFASIVNVMAVAIPLLLLYISLYTVPVVGLFCFSGVGMLQATMYTKVFDKLDEEREKAAEEDRIAQEQQQAEAEATESEE